MLDKFHELLRERGKSITAPRTKLFEYLQKSGPVAIARFMRDNRSIADRASLYRSLAMFQELGIIEERIVRGERVIELSDLYDAHHHHLTCNNCGASIAITMPDIENALVELCRTYGFEATGHTIEASGLCANCQAR
jgi:Fe2+ or Zn2+ uptake regulation protein